VLEVEDVIRILNEETMLGEGSLDSLYVSVYSEDPFGVAGPAAPALASPAGKAKREAKGEKPGGIKERLACCVVQ
jgi:hypothetical protein